MQKDDLKCVLIGRNVKIYNDLARLVRKVDSSSRFRQVEHTKPAIVSTLKKITGASLVFISDDVPFSLESLSDLVWQYSADSIVVIITTKAHTLSLKKPFNNTQFSRLRLLPDHAESESTLQFLIQSARSKAEFRRCKKLLGVSEKRGKWLVDSSREAVSYISRDMHWHANNAYLELFSISSVQELRTITVKDLISSDEQSLFDSFLQLQKKPSNTKRSMMLSMRKLNGAWFRANIYLIPSIYKGHKCFQFWVRKVNSIETVDESIKKENVKELTSGYEIKNTDAKGKSQETVKNPFSALIDENQTSKTFQSSSPTFKKSTDEIFKKGKSVSTKNEATHSLNSLLKGVIKRKEAKIVTQPLSYLKTNESRNKIVPKHQMLSLKVAAAQKKGVDELLTNLSGTFDNKIRSIFWDKVKFSRLLQILLQRDHLSICLLIKVSEASVMDKHFVEWLLPGIKRLGRKSRNLVFLVPSNINESELRSTLLFISEIRNYRCKVALDSFSITDSSLALLKHTKPDYIRLSLPWTRQIQGNELKETRLSSAIRQLERRNIKIIAPCSFSKDMRKLFILSGSSFCQERSIKNAQ